MSNVTKEQTELLLDIITLLGKAIMDYQKSRGFGIPSGELYAATL